MYIYIYMYIYSHIYIYTHTHHFTFQSSNRCSPSWSFPQFLSNPPLLLL